MEGILYEVHIRTTLIHCTPRFLFIVITNHRMSSFPHSRNYSALSHRNDCFRFIKGSVVRLKLLYRLSCQ